MGENCSKAEREEFEPFRNTGGAVRVIIVVCNYSYSPGNELTGIDDGESFQRMAQEAGCSDITILRDDLPVSNSLFPCRNNIKQQVAQIGHRCKPEDFFVFFYAGHGENVPDAPPMDEDDGTDEAFVTPGPNQEIAESMWLIDDDFVALIEKHLNPNTKVLCITDCCHSGTIVDIDSHEWTMGHKIIAIAAAQDNEESADTGHGGILTISIQKSCSDLAVSRGTDKEYSVKSVYDRTVRHAKSISTDQALNVQHNNLDPSVTAWPLCAR